MPPRTPDRAPLLTLCPADPPTPVPRRCSTGVVVASLQCEGPYVFVCVLVTQLISIFDNAADQPPSIAHRLINRAKKKPTRYSRPLKKIFNHQNQRSDSNSARKPSDNCGNMCEDFMPQVRGCQYPYLFTTTFLSPPVNPPLY